MDKIGIVVQRYGLEVNGGAEYHAMILAEHLRERYEVEVITTCAFDDLTWKDHYPPGAGEINGVRVLRFSSPPREPERMGRMFKCMKYGDMKYTPGNFWKLPFKKLRYCGIGGRRARKAFEEFLTAQGPASGGLIEHLREHRDDYSAVIFFTYLYYPTAVGAVEMAGKSILIPTAHDETTLYFNGFGKLFSKVGFIMYNTESERELVERIHRGARRVSADVAGVGFERPDITEEISGRRPLEERYFVYVGRVAESKNCDTLVSDFIEFKRRCGGNVKLVMTGQDMMSKPLPESDDVIMTGFVSEQEKLRYIYHSEALVLPSKYESLSLITLEAMLMGKVVILNGECSVLKAHIDASRAGYAYLGREEFIRHLDTVLNMDPAEKAEIGARGMEYVEGRYSWDAVVDKFSAAIEHIKGGEGGSFD